MDVFSGSCCLQVCPSPTSFYSFLQPSGSAWIPDRPLVAFSLLLRMKCLLLFFLLSSFIQVGQIMVAQRPWRLPCPKSVKNSADRRAGPKPCPSCDWRGFGKSPTGQTSGRMANEKEVNRRARGANSKRSWIGRGKNSVATLRGGNPLLFTFIIKQGRVMTQEWMDWRMREGVDEYPSNYEWTTVWMHRIGYFRVYTNKVRSTWTPDKKRSRLGV